MKIRSGFVSNSSSSSFIVALLKEPDYEPCSHCGRKEVDLFDKLEKAEDYDLDNFSLSKMNKTIFIKQLKSDLKQFEDKIVRYSAMEPSAMPPDFKFAPRTAGEELAWCNTEYNRLIEEIKKYSAVKEDIYKIRTRNDSDIKDDIRDWESKGYIKILDQWDS